jgi:hypothetical protein
MGHTDDPEDGGAVAGAVFGAVFIYIVRKAKPGVLFYTVLYLQNLGILRLLRFPSPPSHQRKPPWRHKPIIIDSHPYFPSSMYRSRIPCGGACGGNQMRVGIFNHVSL